MTTPYERLMAEAIPTSPPSPPRPEPPPKPIGPWTAAEQDAHWQQLCEAVGTPDAQRPPRLRLVVADEEPDTDLTPESEAS